MKFSPQKITKILESIKSLLLTEDDLAWPRLQKILTTYQKTGQFPQELTKETKKGQDDWIDQLNAWAKIIQANPKERADAFPILRDMKDAFMSHLAQTHAEDIEKLEAKIETSWKKIQASLLSNSPRFKSPALRNITVPRSPQHKNFPPPSALETLHWTLEKPPSDKLEAFARQFALDNQKAILDALTNDIETLLHWITSTQTNLDSLPNYLQLHKISGRPISPVAARLHIVQSYLAWLQFVYKRFRSIFRNIPPSSPQI